MVEKDAEDKVQRSTIVGIDEAGYGPMLGPLVVSATAFDVPVSVMKKVSSPAAGPDLWDMLKSSVTPKAAKRDPRLAVADSKKLTNKGGMALLERTALAFFAQNGGIPPSWRKFLGCICPEVVEELDSYPWYAGGDIDLPAGCTGDDIGTQRHAVSSDMESCGVQFRGAWVEVLPVDQYNRQVAATGNKAKVLFGRCARLIQRVADSVGPRPLRVWVDRHGGRSKYRQPLMTAFEDADLTILEESSDRSSYRLDRPEGPWMVRFVKKGEDHHFPVALASIFSKYVRELFMLRFNRYWAGHVSDLKPTAGYVQDGRRFMVDIEAEVKRMQVDLNQLVRNL